MPSEPSLYEKVWGESPPEPRGDEVPPPLPPAPSEAAPLASGAEPAQHHAHGIIPTLFSRLGSTKAESGRTMENSQVSANGHLVDERVLVRLDAIEATLLRLQDAGIETRQQLEACVSQVSSAVSQLHRSVRQSKDASSSQERVLAALEALEARMARTEKGLIRTLEYFQLRLSGSDGPP